MQQHFTLALVVVVLVISLCIEHCDAQKSTGKLLTITLTISITTIIIILITESIR